jgi:DNA-binding MarR family transcriptional regulator
MRRARKQTVTRPALIVDGSDSEFRQLVHDLLAFSGRIEAIRNRFGERIGLTGRQYTILITIAHLQGSEGTGITAVSTHLHLSGAFVTTEVNRLIALDLVEKELDAEDRRRVRLSVSAAGFMRLDELARCQAQVNDALFDCLDRPDFQALRRIFSELVDCADKAQMLQSYLDGIEAPSKRVANKDR